MNTLEPATITINGTTYTAELTTVESTHLGYEDHGIFTVIVRLVGPGWAQSNEPRCLSEYNAETKKQHGTAYAADFILRILDVFRTETWEAIKGRRIYALRTKEFGTILGLANVDNPDNALIFETHHAAFYGTEVN